MTLVIEIAAGVVLGLAAFRWLSTAEAPGWFEWLVLLLVDLFGLGLRVAVCGGLVFLLLRGLAR